MKTSPFRKSTRRHAFFVAYKTGHRFGIWQPAAVKFDLSRQNTLISQGRNVSKRFERLDLLASVALRAVQQ